MSKVAFWAGFELSLLITLEPHVGHTKFPENSVLGILRNMLCNNTRATRGPYQVPRFLYSILENLVCSSGKAFQASPGTPRTPPPPASSVPHQQKPRSGVGAPRSNSNSSAVMSSAQQHSDSEDMELGGAHVAGVGAGQVPLQ